MPLRISEEGRGFVDAAGRPFFWLGDTQWDLLRRFSLADARALLGCRQRQGFTVVLSMIAGCCEQDMPDIAGEFCLVGNDPAQPNERYFERADAVIAVAADLGLQLVLGLFHMRHRALFTEEGLRQFARYCARRWAGAPNVVWSAYPAATPEYVPLARAMAAGLREGDGGAHLITLHPDPSPCSSSFLHDEPWLAFNSSQSWLHYHLAYELTAADYGRTPAKPAVLAEGAYEGAQCGAVHTPHLVRSQAWWAYLAGGHHCYGHAGNFQAVDTWTEWVHSPGAGQMGVCRQVLESLPEWWRLIPAQSLLADAPRPGLARCVAARCANGRWVLAYLPQPTTASFNLAAAIRSANCRGTWISPVDGARFGFGRYATAAEVTTTTPGGWEDTVVLFKAID